MATSTARDIDGASATAAVIVVPVPAKPDGLLELTRQWLTHCFGFAMTRISPADAPSECEMFLSGAGLHVVLRVDAKRKGAWDPGQCGICIEMLVENTEDRAEKIKAREKLFLEQVPTSLRPNDVTEEPKAKKTRIAAAANAASTMFCGPNGVLVCLLDMRRPIKIPDVFAPKAIVATMKDSSFATGRAGMLYRDLVPTRFGGYFVASHIKIPSGGPVPDYVHYHKVEFQLIYCYRGSVKLLYEDQGPPFWMTAGDCVLQPPEIRHRVLESSDGLEVVELGCPAIHDTYQEHGIKLPTDELKPNRLFSGQKFLHFKRAATIWQSWNASGFKYMDTKIKKYSGGAVNVFVIRPQTVPAEHSFQTNGPFTFYFVLEGQAKFTVRNEFEERLLGAGESIALPNEVSHSVACVENSMETEILCVIG